MSRKKRGKKTHEIVWLPIDDVVDNWWNPNTESGQKFSALFDSIQDVGFVEVIQVVSICDELLAAFEKEEDRAQLRGLMDQGKKWLVLHGSHRFEAARLVGKEAMPEIPAVVLEPKDVLKLKALSVRMNIIRGEIDPEKFVKLYEEIQEDPELSEQAAKDMLGVVSQKELDSLIKATKKDLPLELQEALEEAKEEIKTIDDLSRVLNTLFTRYGEDMAHSFLTFNWGGKIHTFIRLTKQSAQILASIKAFCREHNADINDVLIYGWRHALGASEEKWPKPLGRDLSIDE